MKITKVSIDGELDEFGGRALIIKTNSSDVGTIKTPVRVLTSPEFQYKAKMPFKPMLNNDISEVISQLYGKKWERFTSLNKPFENEIGKLNSFAGQAAYTIKKYYPQIASGTPISKKDIHRFIMLQRAGELDFISMPSIPSTNTEFDRIADSFTEEILSENEEPLIYVDMGLDQDIFRNRVSTLLDLVHTGQIHTIGLIYRSWTKYEQNYEYIWDKIRPEEVFLQMSEVPREFAHTRTTSTMHLLQKFGIDSFSVRLVTGRNTNKDAGTETNLNHLLTKRRFDPGPLVFRNFSDWMNHNASLECDCPICTGKTPEEFVGAYRGRYENYPGETFLAANKLHEYYRSTEEFKLSRCYIVDGELKDYFKNKDGLRSSDRPIQTRF